MKSGLRTLFVVVSLLPACAFNSSEATGAGENPTLPVLEADPLQFSSVDVTWTQVEPGAVTVKLATDENCTDVVDVAIVAGEAQAARLPALGLPRGDYYVCAQSENEKVAFQNGVAVSLRKGWYRTDLPTVFPDITDASRTVSVRFQDSIYMFQSDSSLYRYYFLRYDMRTETWAQIQYTDVGLPESINLSPATDGETLWVVGRTSNGGHVFVWDGSRFTEAASIPPNNGAYAMQIGFQHIQGVFWATGSGQGGQLIQNRAVVQALDIGAFKFRNVFGAGLPGTNAWPGDSILGGCIASDADRYVAFAGYYRGAVPHRDMVIYSPATNTALSVPGVGPGPDARANHYCGIVNNQLWVFGGDQNNMNYRNDFWIYDFAAGTWTEQPQGDPDYPTTRSGASMIVHDKGMALIGGYLFGPIYRLDAYFYYP